jgi:DNA-binding transcriptional ArsR family regulator
MNFTNKCIRENVDIKLLSKCASLLEQNRDEILYRSKIFSLLGNEIRLKIIRIFLEYENLCVCDLSDILGMSQSPISQHLRKLKDGGLVVNRREGMTIFYYIPKEKKAQLENFLQG